MNAKNKNWPELPIAGENQERMLPVVEMMTDGLEDYCRAYKRQRRIYVHIFSFAVAIVAVCTAAWHLTPAASTVAVDEASLACRSERIALVDNLFKA